MSKTRDISPRLAALLAGRVQSRPASTPAKPARATSSADQKRAIFLDRDGVLIRTFVRDGVPHPPDNFDQVEILPGVPEALAQLRELGFLLLVVTNQPDVARGTQRREVVEEINRSLCYHLMLDGIYTCYHDNADRCDCRKPAPGLLLRAAAEHNVKLSASFMIGDRASDIAAGQRAGCQTLLIERPYSRCTDVKPDWQVADLLEAASLISCQLSVASCQ
ncbi:MAG TPA: HAD-IIIA family hydrolase [Humisphaera sp.]|nr:HAD-IIIA family hydrolase [Humisphaera sp.]